MTAEEAKTNTTTEEKTPPIEEKAPVKETKAAPEKQTNCLACGKPIRKLKRYYRDGKFYCTKKCWRNYLNKTKEEKK